MGHVPDEDLLYLN